MQEYYFSISNLIDHFPYVGLFMLLILAGIGFPFPEEITLMLSGLLLSSKVIKLYYAIPVIYAGMLAGDLTMYSMGRKLGTEVLTHKRFAASFPQRRLEKLEALFQKYGILLIVAGRHIPVFRIQVFITSGIIKMSPLKFILADGIASLITMSLLVSLGYLAGESFSALERGVVRVEHILTVLAVVALGAALFYSYRKMKK